MPGTAASQACRASRTTYCCAPTCGRTRRRSYPPPSQTSASPTPRSSGGDPVKPYLTLHHPATARRYREQGLWQDNTFYMLAARNASAMPDTIALEDGTSPVTWRQLQAGVDGVA